MPTKRYRSHADYIKKKACDQELTWRSKNQKPLNGYTTTSYSVYNNSCTRGQDCSCVVHSTISAENILVDCSNPKT
jgi:hypothetical protein